MRIIGCAPLFVGLAFEGATTPALGAPAPYELERSTRRACAVQARNQGLRLLGSGRAEVVSGSGGRVIGAQSILDVRRRGRSYQVRCNYSAYDRRARITPVDDGVGLKPPFDMTVGERACVELAPRQGLQVRGSRSTGPVTGSGGRVIGEGVILDVRRAGQSYSVRCSYTYRDRAARITPM